MSPRPVADAVSAMQAMSIEDLARFRHDLLVKAAAIDVLIVARQANDPWINMAKVGPPEPDRAVAVGEAMRLLGMTKDYIHRNWKKLGGRKDVDGRIKFALSALRRHVGTRPGR